MIFFLSPEVINKYYCLKFISLKVSDSLKYILHLYPKLCDCFFICFLKYFFYISDYFWFLPLYSSIKHKHKQARMQTDSHRKR